MNTRLPFRELKARSRLLCFGTAVAAVAFACAAPATAACTLDAPCTVDAALPTNPTGLVLGGGVYTFTVNDPASLWYVSPGVSTDANGGSPTLPSGLNLQQNAGSPLVGGQGANVTTGVGYSAVQLSLGGLTANYGALVAQIGSVYQPIAAKGIVLSGINATGAVSLMMWGNQQDGNAVGLNPCVGFAGSCGTQSVTIAQSTDPTLLAGVNVFAKEHALVAAAQGLGDGKVSAGISLVATKTYYIHPTNPDQLWSIGADTNRTSTAAGLAPSALIFNGTDPNLVPEGYCTAQFPGCTPLPGNELAGPTSEQDGYKGFRYNELVALVGNKYYRVGQGLKLTGVEGDLYLLNWDNDASDNFGFINVAVNLVVPEPASMMLLATALAGFGLARRRRAM